MKPTDLEDSTYLAWLTPPGAAAIAALALRGPRAWEVLRELFRPASAAAATLPPVPPVAEPGRLWLGWLGEQAGCRADQVVLTVKRGGPSPWVEVHCHGGRQVAQMLEDLLTGRGVRACPWPELEGVNPALAVLAAAPTVRTASVALDQVHGAFDRARSAACAALQREDMQEAGRLLEGLARYLPVGRHLSAPWRVAVLGAPNVGKSSLNNRLAGYQRSVVSPAAGTTRDVVSVTVAVDGWPVELLDTAGWREGARELERQGIDLARASATRADVCLWVLDASAPPRWPDAALPAVLYVINKTDLPAAWDVGQAADAVPVSARTGAGLEDLLAVLSHRLVPDPPPPGAAVPFSPALCDRVEEALRRCRDGQSQEALALLRGSP
jgi:tRNA modification GTPase